MTESLKERAVEMQEVYTVAVRDFIHPLSYGQSGVSMSSDSYETYYGSGRFGVTLNLNCRMPD